MSKNGIIRKAICSNSGLPVPDSDYYERKYSGQDRSGSPACDCPSCRIVDEISRRKVYK